MADIFRITVHGAGARAVEFTRQQRAVQDGIIREFRTLRGRLQNAYEDAAPVDTGRLHGSIHAAFWTRARQPTITVRATARDPYGFDYLRVTRFGHRKLVILPKHTRRDGRRPMLKVHYAGHRNPHIFVYRPSVRGSRPSFDWVEQANWLVENALDVAQERLARTVTRRAWR